MAASSEPANPFNFHLMNPRQRAERAQKEYAKVCMVDCDPTTDFTTALRLCHMNRYRDILANEGTIFPASRDPATYINGNLIPLGTPHTIVAAQAPVCGDGIVAWWSSIVESRISLIMMLTKEVERGMLKADRYWPENVGEVVSLGASRYSIRLDEEKEDARLQMTVRRISVLDRGSGGVVHSTTQVQYLGWPDHGIPTSAEAFQYMIRIVEEHPTDAPIIVHCSAGIGRTGTLIGCYAAKRRLEEGRLNNRTVQDVVDVMKRSRRGMVQKLDQYYFIYQCVMEELLRRERGAGGGL